MQAILPRFLDISGGASKTLGALLDQLGVSKPLIVTDAFVITSGLAEPALGSLSKAGIQYEIFAEVLPDPTSALVSAGLARLDAGQFDCIIAIGGGSPIDTAKAMAALHVHGGTPRDYKAPKMTMQPGLPIIAIPTTAGTGSEVTKFTVISDSETGEKMLLPGAAFMPIAALVDFELTMGKPMRLTADTGIDSLTHAIEAYVSRKANPFSDGVAELAMSLISTHIHTACREPDNRDAREGMMRAATLAGMAFSNASVALVHGMSRPIGAHFHVPHGLSNAMLLPSVTAFSLNSALPRYAACARFMNVASPDDADQVAGAKLVDALISLNQDLDVPRMSEYGINEGAYHDKIPVMVEEALGSGSPANNPRVPTSAELSELFEQFYA
ncbi:MAG: iron-containing alcohol dehydrogenase [Pseudomonadota bacterium]